MSFKLQSEKKKAQDEMRKLMIERKNKDKKPIQIQNPLAKYNSAGQLMCILCSSIVRSEHVWQVHVNSKQHRQNIEEAKKLKEKTKNFTDGKVKKRVSNSTTEAPQEKKLKSILKNSGDSVPTALKPKNDAPIIYSHHDEQIKRKPLNSTTAEITETAKDNNEKRKEDESKPNAPIPEGFFDDPVLDAKVCNLQYMYIYEMFSQNVFAPSA
ncbi:unnamed protein product [Leptosia nina]|uniref:Zinc finger double-stranded RNA binding domain-containing protein n=1 Tax=Leptosia nina TaxID=320188 RepID=A0AAV1JD61_9NEOP